MTSLSHDFLLRKVREQMMKRIQNGDLATMLGLAFQHQNAAYGFSAQSNGDQNIDLGGTQEVVMIVFEPDLTG
ncbi:MAG TPA: hypothetical protein DIV46_00205 [Verrucomicrobiales bacterium]|jgi:hypothetical protein|nr:hypothetical protein [Verrucomicrobiales bacterium]|tara:strand:+ start:731 stop:949 length:219 start_codon:yes stop_codon:yes gene_type:complete